MRLATLLLLALASMASTASGQTLIRTVEGVPVPILNAQPVQGNGGDELPTYLAALGIKPGIYDQYPNRPYCPCAVTIHKPPHDADTCTDVTIHLPGQVDLAHVSIRAYGYDAWEVNKVRHSELAGEITDEEVRKGLLAKDAFNTFLLKTGKAEYAENRLYIDIVGRDVFGRVLGWFYIQRNEGPALEWINMAVYIRSNGHQRSNVTPNIAEPVSPVPPIPLPPALPLPPAP